MINDRRGFTFIEVLVSISILSIMAIAGIGSFQRFFTAQQVTRVQEKIINIRRGLDNEVSAGSISSYSLVFLTGSNLLIADRDYLNSHLAIKLSSFDTSGMIGALSTTNTATGVWETKMYIDNIYTKTWLNNASGSSIQINLSAYSGFDEIRIASTINSSYTNNFRIYRLDFTKNEGARTEESYIYSLGGGSFDQVDISNELGNKKIRTRKGATISYTGQIDVGLRRGATEANFIIKK